jgi:solute carrier family 25 (mitochondrial carrier protein), member 16
MTPTSNILTRFPVLKFYRGFTVTLVGMIPYAGISFLTWDFLRAHFIPDPALASSSGPPGRGKPRAKATPVADLSIGAVSGALAQTIAYPFEIVRRRMQIGGLTKPDRWLRWGETVKIVWDGGGWRGFYVGLTIGYLKVVPMTAVSFTVWQGMKRLLDV